MKKTNAEKIRDKLSPSYEIKYKGRMSNEKYPTCRSIAKKCLDDQAFAEWKYTQAQFELYMASIENPGPLLVVPDDCIELLGKVNGEIKPFYLTVNPKRWVVVFSLYKSVDDSAVLANAFVRDYLNDVSKIEQTMGLYRRAAIEHLPRYKRLGDAGFDEFLKKLGETNND